jgi:hypothetical protein
MIGLEDRQSLVRDITEAHDSGARLRLACETAGIDVRTLQRWQVGTGLVAGDGRPQAVRPRPPHALSEAEREQVLRVANEQRFADLPPARIVPMLADEGVYIANQLVLTKLSLGLRKCLDASKPDEALLADWVQAVLVWGGASLRATRTAAAMRAGSTRAEAPWTCQPTCRLQ